MTDEWKQTTIGDISKRITKGTTPTTLGMSFTDFGVNFIKAEALNGDVCLDKKGFSFISDETHKSLGRSILELDDILITIAGANIGKCGYVRKQYLPANTNQAVAIIRTDNQKVIPRYIYYYFKLPKTFFSIQSLNAQAAQPNINLNSLGKIKLHLPPLHIQKKIAAILSAYDDLIENNLKQIKLLEEMAQITYQEWFVRLKFPNHENTPIDETTGLPIGWEYKKLGDCCDIIMGQSPKSEFYNNEEIGLPFHQGVKDYGDRFPLNTCWSTEGYRKANKGDIIFSVRAPVGRLNVAIEEIILGRGLSAIRHKQDYQCFLFYQLQNIFFQDNLMGGGTIFNSVTKNDMFRIEIICPNEELVKIYNSFAEKNDKSIECFYKQNQLLKEARDILLPRLMTGKITVE